VGAQRTKQFLWVAIAAGLLVLAGLVQGPLDKRREHYGLVPPGDVVAQRNPEIAVLTVAPGGLRALVVNYLWIRANQLKDEGRYFDAMQLAGAICRLQPRFPSVWGFHSWNMAWNISVTTRTPQERWLWVSNGLRLLRDEAIPLNPKALILYKDLGWIFYFKMGRYTDEMHLAYKQRWAAQMQRLLAAPPVGGAAEAIEAFRPIADAPLDTDPRRQGGSRFQADKLAELMTDADVASYARLLAERGVKIDDSFLSAYNRWSLDDAVAVVRRIPPSPQSERDKAVSALINNPDHAAARAKMLAFIRAQVLWNEYKMDPQWMLKLMQRYGPLDWRLVQPHGLYWVTYGMHVTQSLGLDDMHSLNTDRILLNCLKDLTWTGRLIYIENPADPDAPVIEMWSDWRFVQTTQAEYQRIINAIIKSKNQEFKDNILAPGHMNYLLGAAEMLLAEGRYQLAGEYFDYVKRTYSPEGSQWDMDVEQFVRYRLNKEGRPTPAVAVAQISASATAALIRLLEGNDRGFRGSMRYAQLVYNVYQKGAPKRLKFRPFEVFVRNVVRDLLLRPRQMGYSLSLADRSRLYALVGRRFAPRMRVMVYDVAERYLRAQCRLEELDFDKAFPAPAGIEEYRAAQRRRLPTGGR